MPFKDYVEHAGEKSLSYFKCLMAILTGRINLFL